jgi:Mg2+ and Co2+ transporter CorA
MAADGHILIVLHELPNVLDPDTLDAKVYWRKPDGIWKSQGSGATTIAALRAHVETFVAAIDELEAKAAKAAHAKDWFDIMHRAAPLHRMARNQAATLAEARDLAKGDKDLIGVRDTAQENERSIELINHHARAGLDYTIASNAEANVKSTEHVVESQHRLNLIAATFLPITAISALLSMNLKHGFEKYREPYAFWAVVAAAFLLGLIVRWSLPAKKKVD